MNATTSIADDSPDAGEPEEAEGSGPAGDSKCEVEVVEDDYGFEIEISSCDEDPIAQQATLEPEALLATIPDRTVADKAQSALATAEASNAECGSLDKWAVATRSAATEVYELAELVSQSGPSAAWVGGAEALQLSDMFRNRLVVQSGCVDGAVDGELTEQVLAAVGAAVGANDDLRVALTAPADASVGSDVWYHGDQVGHRRALADLAGGGGPVETLFIGSSTVRRGFDATLVTEQLERSSFNAGVAGLFSETAPQWWIQLTGAGVTPSQVVIGFAPFEAYVDCTPARKEKADDALTVQDLAFSRIPALGGGDVLSARYEGVLMQKYRDTFIERGTTRSGDGTNSDAIATALPNYQRIMDKQELCPMRQTGFDELVAQATESGAEVIVVAMPLHPQMVALHPAGTDGFTDVIEIHAGTARQNGAAFLDLSSALAEAEFQDLTHANALGREILTQALLVELAR